jgi:phytoene synthase
MREHATQPATAVIKEICGLQMFCVLEIEDAIAYATPMKTGHMDRDLAKTLRKADYDRFLAIQLAPPALRPLLYAVTVFNHELACIAETVSEPMLGAIRLAWWREALEEIVGGKSPRNHPVILALAKVFAHEPAVFTHLFTMIGARAADLDESQLAQEKDWITYLDATAGALHLAWARLLDPAISAQESDSVLIQARSYAMIGLLRAIPYMHAQGFLRFPHAWMNAHDIISLAPSEGLRGLVREVTAKAEALSNEKLIYPKMRPLVALLAVCHMHIKCIKNTKYNPYEIKNPRIRAVLTVMFARGA